MAGDLDELRRIQITKETSLAEINVFVERFQDCYPKFLSKWFVRENSAYASNVALFFAVGFLPATLIYMMTKEAGFDLMGVGLLMSATFGLLAWLLSPNRSYLWDRRDWKDRLCSELPADISDKLRICLHAGHLARYRDEGRRARWWVTPLWWRGRLGSVNPGVGVGLGGNGGGGC